MANSPEFFPYCLKVEPFKFRAYFSHGDSSGFLTLEFHGVNRWPYISDEKKKKPTTGITTLLFSRVAMDISCYVQSLMTGHHKPGL